MKAIVCDFNQEKALVGGFSMIVKMRWIVSSSSENRLCICRYQQTRVLLDTDPDGLLRAANCTRHSAAAFNTALGLLTRNNACSMQPLESCV